MTEQISWPRPFAPMLKCLRRAADVAWVRFRARDVVRMRLGSAAEMWIGVSVFARQCSESVGIVNRYWVELVVVWLTE